MNERLTQFDEVYKKLFEEQIGFRKSKSTVDHIFLLQAIICKYLLNQEEHCIVYLLIFQKHLIDSKWHGHTGACHSSWLYLKSVGPTSLTVVCLV